ncbi:MAG: hypothetical protein JWQ35_54 [Bacteriovoracaceae bacterium]|nr:hypothetical protein [Bacteriovoracaceae bacterium]
MLKPLIGLLVALAFISSTPLFSSQACLDQIVQISKKEDIRLILKTLPFAQTPRMKNFPFMDEVEAYVELMPVEGLPYIFVRNDSFLGSSVIKLTDDVNPRKWKATPGFTVPSLGFSQKLGTSVLSNRFLVSPHEFWLQPYPRINSPLNKEILVMDHQNPRAPVRILKIDDAELKPISIPRELNDKYFFGLTRVRKAFNLALSQTKPYLFLSFETGKILKIDLLSGKTVGRLEHISNIGGANVLQPPSLSVGEHFLVTHSTDRSKSQLIDIDTFKVLRELPHSEVTQFIPELPEMFYYDSSGDYFILTKNRIVRLMSSPSDLPFKKLPENRTDKSGMRIEIHSIKEGPVHQIPSTFEAIRNADISKDESSLLVIENKIESKELVLHLYGLEPLTKIVSQKILEWQSDRANGQVSASTGSSILSLSDGSWLVAVGVWEPIYSHSSGVKLNDDSSMTISENKTCDITPCDPGAGELTVFHVSKNGVKKIFQQPLAYPIQLLRLNELGQLLIQYDLQKIVRAKVVTTGEAFPAPGVHVFSLEVAK